MRKPTTAINTPFARPDAYGSLAMPIYTNVSFEFQDAQEMADVFCNRVKAPDYARIALAVKWWTRKFTCEIFKKQI